MISFRIIDVENKGSFNLEGVTKLVLEMLESNQRGVNQDLIDLSNNERVD